MIEQNQTNKFDNFNPWWRSGFVLSWTKLKQKKAKNLIISSLTMPSPMPWLLHRLLIDDTGRERPSWNTSISFMAPLWRCTSRRKKGILNIPCAFWPNAKEVVFLQVLIVPKVFGSTRKTTSASFWIVSHTIPSKTASSLGSAWTKRFFSPEKLKLSLSCVWSSHYAQFDRLNSCLKGIYEMITSSTAQGGARRFTR